MKKVEVEKILLIEDSHLDGFVAEDVAGCFDGGDVSLGRKWLSED